jgi:hypothetical protein
MPVVVAAIPSDIIFATVGLPLVVVIAIVVVFFDVVSSSLARHVAEVWRRWG